MSRSMVDRMQALTTRCVNDRMMDRCLSISTRVERRLQILKVNLFGVRYPNIRRISSMVGGVFLSAGETVKFGAALPDSIRSLKPFRDNGCVSYGRLNATTPSNYPVAMLSTSSRTVETAPAASANPPAPLLENPQEHFLLDRSIDFLNHGSFGARPRAVLEAQARRRAEFESRPIQWLDPKREGGVNIARAKHALGQFIGAKPQDLGFVTNATGAVNAVIRSLQFQPGDELLTTTHVYNAVRQTMRHLAERSGAQYREIDIPLPLADANSVPRAVANSLNDRTRLLVIDHGTSPTALVFPVREIVDLCQSRGVDVFIDGAHAPGMLPLDIQALQPAYYAGNLHKWVSAPVGAAFLWARPDRQRGIHPPVISHYRGEGFAREFLWQATRDITPWLCVEDALAWFAALGWERVRQHNHQLATWAHRLLCEQWDVQPASPPDGCMLGSMATIPLPSEARLRKDFERCDVLQAVLHDQFRIEAPIVDWSGRWWVRVSCHIYNRPEQYQRLADSILRLLK